VQGTACSHSLKAGKGFQTEGARPACASPQALHAVKVALIMQLSPGLEVPVQSDGPTGGSKVRYVNLLGDQLNEFGPSYPGLV